MNTTLPRLRALLVKDYKLDPVTLAPDAPSTMTEALLRAAAREERFRRILLELSQGCFDVVGHPVALGARAERIALHTPATQVPLFPSPAGQGVASGAGSCVHAPTLQPSTVHASALFGETMSPAVERGIPLYIRNTFRPDAPGTRIDAEGGTLVVDSRPGQGARFALRLPAA